MERSDNNLLGNGEKGSLNWKTWRSVLVGFMGVILGMVIVVLSIGASISTTYSAADVTVTPTPFTATTEAKRVEYYLPYPGILPDSPLYKLKMVRDRVKLWLTFDEGEKAKLELAYADKRINAAAALASGNKLQLAVTTATKAQKYLEQSTDRVIKLIKSGKDEKSLLLTLEKATEKHAEVLADISIKPGEQEDNSLAEAMRLNKLFGERIRQTLVESK